MARRRHCRRTRPGGDVPVEDTPIGIRERAMLALFLHGALRIGEVAKLWVRGYTPASRIPILRVRGKRRKTGKVELHSVAQQRLEAWLDVAGIRKDLDGPLPAVCETACRSIVTMEGRATAITQALEEGAELSRVQDWAGHASPATTKLYDRRHLKPEDSPSFKTNY